MTDKTRLSVIVPCFNEAAYIISVLEAVRAQRVEPVEVEVIVVDDGSTDATPSLLRDNPHLYDHLILADDNQGKGAAVRAGLEVATGTHVLFQDADLEYDPREYPALLAPVINYDADLVFGSRLRASPCTRVAYFWHQVGNRGITLAFNFLNNTTFSDIYSGYLLIRRSLLQDVELRVDGWAQQAEILGKVVPRAKRMYEIPISYFGRTYEEGKKIRWYHAAHVVGTIASVRATGRALPSWPRKLRG